MEENMKVSLKDISLEAIEKYTSAIREEWVLNWPGQIVLCGSLTNWTNEVSDAIIGASVPRYLKKCTHQINQIVAMVRGKLTAMARITLGALIVIDVHARDVVDILVKNHVTTLDDFNWLCQLRYYLEDETIFVRMITTSIKYGYEYLGNSSRLVITPLTDRYVLVNFKSRIHIARYNSHNFTDVTFWTLQVLQDPDGSN